MRNCVRKITSQSDAYRSAIAAAAKHETTEALVTRFKSSRPAHNFPAAAGSRTRLQQQERRFLLDFVNEMLTRMARDADNDDRSAPQRSGEMPARPPQNEFRKSA